MSATNDWPYIP